MDVWSGRVLPRGFPPGDLREIFIWLEAKAADDLPAALRSWQCFVPFGEGPQRYAWSNRPVPQSCEAVPGQQLCLGLAHGSQSGTEFCGRHLVRAVAVPAAGRAAASAAHRCFLGAGKRQTSPLGSGFETAPGCQGAAGCQPPLLGNEGLKALTAAVLPVQTGASADCG